MNRLFGLIILILLGVGGWLFWSGRAGGDLLTPLSSKLFNLENSRKMEVVGFLPTWMVGKTKIYGNELSELVFLGIEVGKDGGLIWDSQSKKIFGTDFEKQKNEVKNSGGKVAVGLKLFKDNDIDKFLASEMARAKLVEEVRNLVGGGRFDGINVDFEYQGSPTKILSRSMLDFLGELKKGTGVEVGIDVFANTMIKGDGEDLAKFISVVDRFIVMAYDFHRPGSNNSGPVAPLRSVAGSRSLIEVVERVVEEKLDKKKIILALPLYGYVWRVEDDGFGSLVVGGGGEMVSFNRAKRLIKEEGLAVDADGVLGEGEFRENFDEESMTPWVVYKKRGKLYSAYFENSKSIGVKVALARQTELAGVGFWALGYEGEDNIINSLSLAPKGRNLSFDE